MSKSGHSSFHSQASGQAPGKSSVSSSTPVWRLKKGMDRRFRSGHPWVYSNELMESPKGIQPGQLVELHDAGGKFLARGFGNPSSLISFRTLTRDFENKNPLAIENLTRTLQRAQKLRLWAGWKQGSYRLCFGEADHLPGLVIDRYQVPSGQVFVVQAHTAGADGIVQNLLEVLEKFVRETPLGFNWDQTAVVLRNDLSVRKLEGVEEQEPQILKPLANLDLSNLPIQIRSVLGDDLLNFQVDLIRGQKTGFFLDQFANIQLAALRFQNFPGDTIRILDLFCYVGQWGTQLAHVFKSQGRKVEVVAVDASQQALDFAKKNIEAVGAKCETIKGDILKELPKMSSGSFDIVISDPPALIKSRKDIPTGTHAYLQLATQVFRVAKADLAGTVCCSCSALLDEEEFIRVLSKAAGRNRVSLRWVSRGTQSPDHPVLSTFPEGRYLKCWVGMEDADTGASTVQPE